MVEKPESSVPPNVLTCLQKVYLVHLRAFRGACRRSRTWGLGTAVEALWGSAGPFSLAGVLGATGHRFRSKLFGSQNVQIVCGQESRIIVDILLSE